MEVIVKRPFIGPFLDHSPSGSFGNSNGIRVRPGSSSSSSPPAVVLPDGRVSWSDVHQERLRCWGAAARRNRGRWDPFECQLELASWTMDANVTVMIVVDEEDADNDDFGRLTELDDSVGVRCCSLLQQ